MARLLSLAFGMIFALLVAAQLLGSRHPLPVVAIATPASQAAGQATPWSREPARDAFPPANPFVQAMVIARDASGRFALTGTINGRARELLVDTGADVVAIPVGQAADLGIPVAPDEFRPILRTASGTAKGAPVRIASLGIGSHQLRDVDAVVVEGLDTVLLGQSALRRLGKVTIDGDHMAIGGS